LNPSPNFEVETGNSATMLRPCSTRSDWLATSTAMERAGLLRGFFFAMARLAGIFARFPMSRNYHVAIAGATGAVGIEMMRVLERRNFPVGRLTLLASAKSAGKKLDFQGEPVEVRELTADAFGGVDFALFSAGGGISKEFAPAAVKAGAVVIDNSSVFRMDPGVPLVVPEINPEAARAHQGILANPNCTTAITLMGLWPLHQAFGVKRLWASSYQAVSGSGAKAIEELRSQVEALARGEEPPREVYPCQIAFNVIPQVDAFLESGYTKEEMKMENEGRKIMGLPGFRASVTCVRVPVYRAHSVAVSAEFERPVSVAAARAALEKAPGLRVVDEPSRHVYPVPLNVAGKDDCEIGRLRADCALENGLSFWICGDQLLKGAALNAVQIAELLV
jgi:aspartate-semialdehyde dehydrogenase